MTRLCFINRQVHVKVGQPHCQHKKRNMRGRNASMKHGMHNHGIANRNNNRNDGHSRLRCRRKGTCGSVLPRKEHSCACWGASDAKKVQHVAATLLSTQSPQGLCVMGVSSWRSGAERKPEEISCGLLALLQSCLNTLEHGARTRMALQSGYRIGGRTDVHSVLLQVHVELRGRAAGGRQQEHVNQAMPCRESSAAITRHGGAVSHMRCS